MKEIQEIKNMETDRFLPSMERSVEGKRLADPWEPKERVDEAEMLVDALRRRRRLTERGGKAPR